jgi:hypothetical protein
MDHESKISEVLLTKRIPQQKEVLLWCRLAELGKAIGLRCFSSEYGNQLFHCWVELVPSQLEQFPRQL